MIMGSTNYILTLLISFFVVLTFSLTPGSSQAQIPSITLDETLNGERITDRLIIYKTNNAVSPDSVWFKMSENPNIGELEFGFTESYFWLGLTFEKPSGGNEEWLLEIENPHYNYLNFYRFDYETQTWETVTESGRRTPFSTRVYSHFNYVFPIQFDETGTANLLFYLDKKNSSISYHTRVWKASDFTYYQQAQYTFIGIYFGIFFLILTASLIAFLFSRKSIYFWYLIYVTSVGLYIFTDVGLSQQFIWPELYQISSFARVALACAMVLSFILFTREYFNTKENYPRINTIFISLIVSTITIISFYILFTETFRANATFFLTVLYTIILLAISLAIYTSASYLKRQPKVAAFFLAAFAFIFIGSFITISAEFGLISDNRFLFTPLQIGSIFEIMFLTCGLGWRIKVINQEQRDLQNRINKLQNEKLKAYIEGIEEERRRLAMDLHDSIGNRLAHLKRITEKKSVAYSTLQDEIQSIIIDVRQLSHQLSPPAIGLTGLEKSIKQIINQTNQESDINYHFQSLDIPEKLPDDYTIQVYRIVQEAIQNIEKHSKAKEALIQFIGYSDQLILTIEDDGVGFSESEKVDKSGIGLNNINKRAEQLGGYVEISSQKNRGVQYLISIPLPRAYQKSA